MNKQADRVAYNLLVVRTGVRILWQNLMRPLIISVCTPSFSHIFQVHALRQFPSSYPLFFLELLTVISNAHRTFSQPIWAWLRIMA